MPPGANRAADEINIDDLNSVQSTIETSASSTDPTGAEAKSAEGQAVREHLQELTGDPTPEIRQSLTEMASGHHSQARASSQPGIRVDVAQLDADPYLFNCRNGVVDLHTLELRQHDPRDDITKMAGGTTSPTSRSALG